ncbi:MAG: phosphoribosylanthranilate isomerase [Hyphomonadaceae bacterium]
MPNVKICGVTRPEAVDAALAGGARFIGLVFFPKSPRHVSLESAAALAARARGRAEIAAVTVNASDAELAAIAKAVQPDWIQLHGDESVARTAAARAFGKVIKAIAVSGRADLDAAAAFEPAADMLLFDAKAPAGADRPGGLGAAFDWKLLEGRRFSRPWMLSGGLTPENVGEAIRASGADFVDASSSLESAPGLKDPARIAAFLAAAHKIAETV